jgi:pyruvate formate lyase activating enzyme
MSEQENEIRGSVFNIQRYSIHDGPGIRTTVFLKGCPLRCFWCQNPESQRKEPEILLFEDNCTRCGRCVEACPSGASSLSDTASVIDRSKCTGCGKCAEVCPNEARKLTGAAMTVDEVMEEVMRDASFYKNSGGGVTLSGGDPIAQPEFALALLRSCKGAGLHTALDTTGFTGWETLEKLLEYTDLVLFDIKQIDDVKHREGTNVSNKSILENARRIAGLKPMRVRVPLIPGYNDSREEIRALARFVRSELGFVEIDLHPYNKLGEVKWERLDKEAEHFDTQADEYVQELKDIIASEMSEVVP